MSEQHLQYPHIAARLFNTPHLIEADKLRAIACALSDRFGVTIEGLPTPLREGALSTERGEKPKPYRIMNSIGVIPVMGTLVHRSGWMDAMSGLTSYESIQNAFDAAHADADVESILLHIDSPGGEASGAFDLADHILNAAGEKPVLAFGDGMMASAAYLIASAADQIFVSQSTLAGSIGVRTLHVDQSKFNEAHGFVVTEIFAGARKIDGTPHAPLTAESMTAIQGRVDDLYDLFVSAVSRNRGLTTAHVRGTEAGIFTGEKAVTHGLADGVRTLDQLLSTANPATTSEQSHTERRQEEMEKETFDSVAALEGAYPELIEQVRTESAKAERARIKDIWSLAPKGQSALATKLAFEEPVSADAAARQLLVAQIGDRAQQLAGLYHEAPDPIPPVKPKAENENEGVSLMRAAAQQYNEEQEHRARLRVVHGGRQ